MGRLQFALIILLLSATAWAFDLGGLLEQAGKKKPAAQETTPATSSPSQQDNAKQTELSGLPGLVAETPVEEEVAIGREIAGRLLGATMLVDDPKLQHYVNRVGKWVALQSGRHELTWHFGVVASEDINAFAMPGGYILVTRGLYKRLNNEAELAGVLAHEIGHVIKKHHLKILKQSQAIDAGSGMLRSKVAKDEKGELIARMIGSGAEIMARALDKAAEHEADRIGVVLATRAGYDAYGLPAVLQDIGHVSANDSSVSLLFKTHPHPNARLSRLDDAMRERFIDIDGGQSLPGRLYRIK